MSKFVDNEQRFVEFYSNLIKQYEQTVRTRTMFAVLFGAGFFTVTAMFILFVILGTTECVH